MPPDSVACRSARRNARLQSFSHGRCIRVGLRDAERDVYGGYENQRIGKCMSHSEKQSVNALFFIACTCILISCRAASMQEWGVDVVSSCDSGVKQTVRTYMVPGESEEDRIVSLDAIVFGACGRQLLLDIDSSLSFRMKQGDSAVRFDFRFDGYVVENWVIHNGRLDEEWRVGVDRRPFNGGREDDAPDTADVFYFICYGDVCVGKYR